MSESRSGTTHGWPDTEPATREASDEALMMRYRDGDAGAFDGLYQRHRGGVYRYLLRLTRSAQTAEELFQDVWMNLIRHRHRYEPTARFATFIYRMAHNRFVDHCRRMKHRGGLAETEHVQEQVDPAPDPFEHLSREESRAQFAAAVAELPEAQREAFLLRQETGLGVASIAEITGVNAETAKSRLRYAVNRLKRTLRGVA